MINLNIMAATESGASGNILDVLGIEWDTLIFQIIAFLILVFVLGKWVYPIFMGIVDKRQADIEASAKAADEAKASAAEAEEQTAELIRQARAEASEIIATAKDEATATIDAAEKKAKARAETILASAEVDIEKQVAAAKKTLHNETIDLVARATEKVLGATVSASVDEKLIKEALKEAK